MARLDEVLGPSRVDAVVQVRHQAMFALYQWGFSIRRIARMFNRDRSTVLSAVRNMEKRRRYGL